MYNVQLTKYPLSFLVATINICTNRYIHTVNTLYHHKIYNIIDRQEEAHKVASQLLFKLWIATVVSRVQYDITTPADAVSSDDDDSG